MAFGKHLMLDLRECDQAKLDDLELCFALLNDIPDRIKMKKISAPHVFRYRAEQEEDRGITGVTLIAESHISLHTFPVKGHAFADVFSCKPFDVDLVIAIFVQAFAVKKFDSYTQDRGKHFTRQERLQGADIPLKSV